MKLRRQLATLLAVLGDLEIGATAAASGKAVSERRVGPGLYLANRSTSIFQLSKNRYS